MLNNDQCEALFPGRGGYYESNNQRKRAKFSYLSIKKPGFYAGLLMQSEPLRQIAHL